MTRRRNRFEDDDEIGGGSLDLAPFMNMAMILIPMLLLSVAFLKIGVVNVSTPELSPGPQTASDTETKDQWSLTVAVGAEGFRVVADGSTLPAIDGCEPGGPTVCMANPEASVLAKAKQARRAFDAGDQERGEALLEEVVGAYDYAGLYNELRALKEEHPDHTKLRLTASPEIPFQLLIRVMDAVRYRLEPREIASNERFWEVNTAVRERDGRKARLFSDPVLAVGRR